MEVGLRDTWHFSPFPDYWTTATAHRRDGEETGVTNVKGKRPAIEGYIAAMSRILIERFHPQQIILFGSQARDNAEWDSDVDLLVIMPHEVDRMATEVEMRRAVRDIPMAKDIIVTTSEEFARRSQVAGTVLRAAAREGRILYAQD